MSSTSSWLQRDRFMIEPDEWPTAATGTWDAAAFYALSMGWVVMPVKDKTPADWPRGKSSARRISAFRRQRPQVGTSRWRLLGGEPMTIAWGSLQ